MKITTSLIKSPFLTFHWEVFIYSINVSCTPTVGGGALFLTLGMEYEDVTAFLERPFWDVVEGR